MRNITKSPAVNDELIDKEELQKDISIRAIERLLPARIVQTVTLSV